MFGLSLYGNYHFYYLANPFSATYFGLSCASTFLTAFILLNASMQSTMTAIEMMILPTRDTLRFVMMQGSTVEVPISTV